MPWELVLPLAAQYGALGLVCLWLMWRVEKKLDAQREAIEGVKYALNRMTQTQLLEVTTREDVPDRVKRIAQELLEQINREQAVADAATKGPAQQSGVMP